VDLIQKKKYVIKAVIAYVQEQENEETLLEPINRNIGKLISNTFTRDIALE